MSRLESANQALAIAHRFRLAALLALTALATWVAV
jgi:hypothetical protein